MGEPGACFEVAGWAPGRGVCAVTTVDDGHAVTYVKRIPLVDHDGTLSVVGVAVARTSALNGPDLG